MKKYLVTGFTCLIAAAGFSQNMGVGTNTPNPSAKLEIADNSRGLLIPRVALTNITSFAPMAGVAANSNALLVYNTSNTGALTPGYYYWNTASWVRLQDSAGWNTTGNSGTNSGINFIGTTDTAGLAFRINNLNAGFMRLDGKGQTFWGIGAGDSIKDAATSNTAFGFAALKKNTTGDQNTAFGNEALAKNATGNYNTAVGKNSLNKLSTGSNNTAIGINTMYETTTANDNTAAGFQAMFNNLTGHSNTAIGANALQTNTDGVENIALGKDALRSCQFADYNTAVGTLSLRNLTNGAYNTAIGRSALLFMQEGVRNTSIGYSALANCKGSYNTALGAETDMPPGSLISNSTAIGYKAFVPVSNMIRLGNTDITKIEGQVAFTTPSDGRFKFNVQENVSGLAFIMALRPVTYNFDTKKFDHFLHKTQHEDSNYSKQNTAAATNRVQTGFIAQEVEAAALKSGYNFDGVNKPKNGDDYYSLAYSQFVVPLVQAVKEQQAIIETQQQINARQQLSIDNAAREIEQLKQQIKMLLEKSSR